MIEKFSVPDPCHEPWDGMKPQENGRYCDVCKKVVIDFTHKSQQEIIDYIKLNKGKKLCGTFKKSQLNESSKERDEYTIRFISAVLLAFGMSLFSCSGDMGKSIDLGDQPKSDTFEQTACTTTTGVIIPSVNPLGISPNEIETTTGDISIAPNPPTNKKITSDTNDLIVGVIAEDMPEFNNGGQTLQEYLNMNIVYPPNHDIQGTVYVSFIVTKDGRIEDVLLLRGIGKEYDDEALRIVRSMPKWKPGKNMGQAVNVRFNLPIKFKLQ